MSLSDQNLRQIFEEVDIDKSGHIDEEEIKQACIKCDLDVIVAPAMVRSFDLNKDGKITVDEFITFYKEYNLPDKKIVFTRLFKAIDVDNNGFISVDEMMIFTSLIGEATTREEAAGQLKDLDQDNDGKVNLDELWAVFDGCF